VETVQGGKATLEAFFEESHGHAGFFRAVDLDAGDRHGA
jgi:hypothetical protein